MIRTLLLGLTLATPLAAQDSLATQTAAAAARLSAAEQLMAEAPHSGEAVATLVAAVQTYEDGLIAVSAGLRDTAAQQDALERALREDRAQVAQLLAVLQTQPLNVQPTLAIHPGGMRRAAQAQMIRSAAAPALQQDAADLRAKLGQLQKVAALQETATATYAAGEAGLLAAHMALQQALDDQPDLPARFDEDAEVIAALQDAAPTRDEFVAALTRIHAGGLPNDAALASKGALPLMVTGRALPRDAEATGLIIATPPQALLVAPTSATVLYQGPLPGFDLAVVLEPTPGTTFVFGGLSRTFAQAGQLLPAGWPIGLVGGAAEPSDAELSKNIAVSAGNDAQALYLEVRDGQGLTDPATWFALEKQVDVK